MLRATARVSFDQGRLVDVVQKLVDMGLADTAANGSGNTWINKAGVCRAFEEGLLP